MKERNWPLHNRDKSKELKARLGKNDNKEIIFGHTAIDNLTFKWKRF